MEEEPSRSGKIQAILVASIILLPVIIWIVFISWGETRCKPLIVFKITNAQGDSIPRTIGKYPGLITEKGKPFDATAFEGKKHHLASFIFTTCPTTCPMVTREMKKIFDSQKNTKDLEFVSYSVDPQADTPSVLAAYKKANGITAPNWTFVTGDSASLVNIIRKDYFQPYQEAPGQREKITHSNMIMLVDKDLRIRGFYSTLNSADMKKLEEELNVLRCEYRAADDNER